MSKTRPTTEALSTQADATDFNKKKICCNKTLKIAIPIILAIIGIAGAALITLIIVTLATKGSIFKSVSVKICQSSNSILGCTENAISSVNLKSLNCINQSLLDESLLKIWSRIKPQLPNIQGLPSTPIDIRAWLNDPSNKNILDSVVKLDLSNLGLEVLPDSIKNLKELVYLDLTNNKFSSFPTQITYLNKTNLTGRIIKFANNPFCSSYIPAEEFSKFKRIAQGMGMSVLCKNHPWAEHYYKISGFKQGPLIS